MTAIVILVLRGRTLDASGSAGLPQMFCEDPTGNLVELNTGWAQQPLGAAR